MDILKTPRPPHPSTHDPRPYVRSMLAHRLPLRLVHIYRLVAKTYALRALAHQTLGIHPMLFQCWASVKDGGPTTLKQQWVNDFPTIHLAWMYAYVDVNFFL